MCICVVCFSWFGFYRFSVGVVCLLRFVVLVVCCDWWFYNFVRACFADCVVGLKLGNVVFYGLVLFKCCLVLFCLMWCTIWYFVFFWFV